MPAPRKLPDNTTLRQLRAQDWTLQQIADEYGVTEAAVWKALERAGFTESRETYQDIIPWDIDPRHRSTAVAQRLRAIVRLKRGQTLTPTDQHLLDTWLQAMKDGDVVLDYHKDAPPNAASRVGGFFYVQREPRDEGGFVRMPDSGSKKKAPSPTLNLAVPAAEKILVGAVLN